MNTANRRLKFSAPLGTLLDLALLAISGLFILLTVAWTSSKPTPLTKFVELPKGSIVLINTVYENESGQYQRKCRGILTANRKVLTALHCIPDKSKEQLKYVRVSFVDKNMSSVATRYGIGFKKLSRDMAVIYLTEDAPASIQRVPLTRIKGSDYYFATAVLREKNEFEYAFKTVTGKKRAIRGESPEDFVIKLNKTSSEICHGDSGGPVFAYDSKEVRYNLVGVISYVAGSAAKCSGDYFTIENSQSPIF